MSTEITYQMLVERFKEWDNVTFYLPFYGADLMVNVGISNQKDFSIQTVTIRNSATGLTGVVEAWGIGEADVRGPFFPKVIDVYSTAREAQEAINEHINSAVISYRRRIKNMEDEIARIKAFSKDTQ